VHDVHRSVSRKPTLSMFEPFDYRTMSPFLRLPETRMIQLVMAVSRHVKSDRINPNIPGVPHARPASVELAVFGPSQRTSGRHTCGT
jgi:hypothetical protein